MNEECFALGVELLIIAAIIMITFRIAKNDRKQLAAIKRLIVSILANSNDVLSETFLRDSIRESVPKLHLPLFAKACNQLINERSIVKTSCFKPVYDSTTGRKLGQTQVYYFHLLR